LDNEEKGKLTKGDDFGDLALLYNVPRSASIRSDTYCEFWVLNEAQFQELLESLLQAKYNENRQFIEKITFFRNSLMN